MSRIATAITTSQKTITDGQAGHWTPVPANRVEMENLAALLPAAFALMASPGPVTLASAGFGAAWGRQAVPLVLAMTAGTATIIVMVALGVLALVAALPGAEPVLTVLGGIYILYLAWKIWSAAPLKRSEQSRELPSVAGVYAVALANPKAYAAMAALFSGFPLIEGNALSNGVVKVALLIGLATCINLSWMIVGSALASVFEHRNSARLLNRTFAVLLVISVGAMFVL